MINVVIIGHNEEKSVIPMLSSLSYYLPEARRIWVLDRCTDKSRKILDFFGEEYHQMGYFKNGFGRKTSTCRNYGLSFCDKDADVIFLDGDRYIKKFEQKELNRDIVLFKCETDERTDEKVAWNKGRIYNMFYSCGFYIKRDCINRIIDFQGELFNTQVEKNWGSEDLYLGDICYHLGIDYTLGEIILNGKIEGKDSNGYDSIRKRFELRSKLNVLWY